MNNSNENQDKENKISKVPTNLARNSLYSFFTTYSSFFFALSTSFLLARMISIEVWGYLILTTSYLTIITIILTFFPPGLSDSLNYYIPLYTSLNQMKKLKSFLINLFFFRLITVIILYAIAMFLISFFTNIFIINLGAFTNLLYILSPSIIFIGINSFLGGFNLGFGMFKTRFYLNLISNSVLLGGYLILLIFIKPVEIEVVALITVFSLLLPFLINCLIFTIKILKIKTTDEERINFKDSLQKVLEYGSFTGANVILEKLWAEAQLQAIGTFESPSWVTGFNISNHYTDISKRFIGTIRDPMITSFSALDIKKDFNQIEKILRIVIKFSLFFTLITTGLLIFVVDFFLIFIYGEDYLLFSLLMKLILLTMTFGIINTVNSIMIKTTNRVKLFPILFFIFISYKIFFFFFGLIYFGIIGAVIGLLISNIITLFLSNLLLFKLFKIKSDFRKILLLYLVFFISLFFAFLLGNLFLNQFSSDILRNLNLEIFGGIQIFSMVIFLIFFILLNYFINIFTKQDIEYIELIFTKDKRSHNTIKKLLRFIKRFLK